jgi:hypothetical protein
MRLAWVVFATGCLTGCAGGLAERQAELTQWVGQPESQLVAALGAPQRTYDDNGMKFLTYEDVHLEQLEPSGPFYFGPGPAAPTGFGGRVAAEVCDTTFTVAGGVVKAFSLQGNGCG